MGEVGDLERGDEVLDVVVAEHRGERGVDHEDLAGDIGDADPWATGRFLSHRSTTWVKVVEPAGIGTRWHDTPTSKPPASQPNSTYGSYRHAQEVTDSMSIETVDTRARSAAAVALVRHRAPETLFLPIAARSVPDHPGYFQVNRVDRTGRAYPDYPVAGPSRSTR